MTDLTVSQSNALQSFDLDAAIIEKALMLNNLSELTPKQRVQFYRAVCASVGLNPLTQPFTMLKRQDGSLWLYENDSCAKQLRDRHLISCCVISRQTIMIGEEPLHQVEVKASMPDGRSYTTLSVVSLTKPKQQVAGRWPDGNPKYRDLTDDDGNKVLIPLRGTELANAIMKADTKAHRRATMGLVGLGWLTERAPQGVQVSVHTGEIFEAAPVYQAQPRENITDAEHSKNLDEVFSVEPGAPRGGAEERARLLNRAIELCRQKGLSTKEYYEYCEVTYRGKPSDLNLQQLQAVVDYLDDIFVLPIEEDNKEE